MVNILVGCTGSVATIKLPILLEYLQNIKVVENKVDIKVVVTEHAKHFYNEAEVPSNIPVLCDKDEWSLWSRRGDPVLHIDLGKWADIFLIAPLDANTLAKIANGLCDNLLTCVARAWDTTKPLIFCPAMNTRMYQHPLTKKQIDVLRDWGYCCLPVVEKVLVCGDVGSGAMAEVTTIVDYIKFKVLKINDL